jgi:predicted transcriptional regulator of viral defense system
MLEPQISLRTRTLALAEARGIARARDFKAAGIPLVYLRRLCDDGSLVRLDRGLYQRAEHVGTDIAHDLAEAARLVPNGVISLASALRYHGLTTQLPHAVWMTIPHKARTPKPTSLRLEIVRATGAALTAGVEHVKIEGVDVPIYGVAKTICDCFKHRRHIGEDVAIEALRDGLRQKKTTPVEIMSYAAINRVARLVLPLLQVLQ